MARQGSPKAILIELTLLQEKAELQTVRQWVAWEPHDDWHLPGLRY